MTIATDVVASTATADALRARPAGLVHDVSAIAGRALRGVPRDLEAVMPPIFIALFFFVVNIATLSKLTRVTGSGFDYKAFEMPTAILLGVTGVSRAPALVLDIQNGYFDRLLMTPVSRLAILLGHMVADVTVAMALTIPVLALGFAIGVRFETGLLGVVVFIMIAALWSLAFSGFGYAIALEDRQSRGSELDLLAVLPVLVLDVVVRAPVATLGLAAPGCRTQPGDVRARGFTFARHPGLDLGLDRQGPAGDRVARRAEHVALLRRTPRPDPSRLNLASVEAKVQLRPARGGNRDGHLPDSGFRIEARLDIRVAGRR